MRVLWLVYYKNRRWRCFVCFVRCASYSFNFSFPVSLINWPKSCLPIINLLRAIVTEATFRLMIGDDSGLVKSLSSNCERSGDSFWRGVRSTCFSLSRTDTLRRIGVVDGSGLYRNDRLFRIDFTFDVSFSLFSDDDAPVLELKRSGWRRAENFVI